MMEESSKCLNVCRLGHGVARQITCIQTGKHIDLSMEMKCLRREGSPAYIDFSGGYAVVVEYAATHW